MLGQIIGFNWYIIPSSLPLAMTRQHVLNGMSVSMWLVGAYALLPHVYTPYIDPEDGGRRRLLSMKTQTDDEIREAYRYHARFSTNGYSVATNGNSTFDYNSNLITYTYTRKSLAHDAPLAAAPTTTTKQWVRLTDVRVLLYR